MSLPKLELTAEELAMVEAMGGTGFTPEEIAEVLERPKALFLEHFRDHESDLYKKYRKGFLEASFKLRQRIFKDAGHGSSPAQALGKKIMDDCQFKTENLERE